MVLERRPPAHVYVMGLALILVAGQAAGPVAGGISGLFVGVTWAYWDWGFTWPLPPRGFGFALEALPAGPSYTVDRYGTAYELDFSGPAGVPAFEPCRVYWGSHGCALPRGHADGPDGTPHLCECALDGDYDPETRLDADGVKNVGGPPYYGPETRFYGEDA